MYVELKKKEFENRHIEFNRGSISEERATEFANQRLVRLSVCSTVSLQPC